MIEALKSRAVVERPIHELTPYDKNPRTHSQRQIEQIAKSIKRFGLKGPARHLHLSQRKHERSDVRIMADIRVSGGHRHKVRIIDLSRTGFQMECLVYIPADRPVSLTMPGFMHLECSVAWHSDWHYGCAFTAPLHEAIYDHIVDLYPGIMPIGVSCGNNHIAAY